MAWVKNGSCLVSVWTKKHESFTKINIFLCHVSSVGAVLLSKNNQSRNKANLTPEVKLQTFFPRTRAQLLQRNVAICHMAPTRAREWNCLWNYLFIDIDAIFLSIIARDYCQGYCFFCWSFCRVFGAIRVVILCIVGIAAWIRRFF